VTEVVSTDGEGEDAYVVNEPPISGQEQHVSALSPAVVVTDADSDTSDKTESSVLPEDSQAEVLVLKKAMAEQDKKLDILLNAQVALLDKLQEGIEIDSQRYGVVLTMKEDVNAVLKSNEALTLLVTEVGKNQAAEAIERKQAVPRVGKLRSAGRDEVMSEMPPFSVSTYSTWGDEVTLVIEAKGGFSKNARLGSRVDGWMLMSIDLRTKESVWRKGNDEQILKIG
jgi:hypothetical protein